MVARSQRVSFGEGPDTYTVVGDDGLPIGPAAEYLRFLRDGGASPHTVRAYAAGIADWFTVLSHTGHVWDDFPTTLFGQYLQFLRTDSQNLAKAHGFARRCARWRLKCHGLGSRVAST
ncbi:transposase [Mycobacterium europaeum]|uniref:Transposase n=1 Tax=Mycobacterium europaeum TaxID=761804 RepID=A0A0U1DAB0_9MYCO|nr:transposase [Mycobacterium europaeum]